MGLPIRAALLVPVAGLALGGCAAAIVPVAASGLLAHGRLRHHHHRAPADPAPRPVALAAADAAPPAGTMPAPAPSPAAARPASPDAASPPADAPGADAPAEPGWEGLVRHVAQAMIDGTTASVLLDRSTTAARPVWVPCGDKPRAVLVDLDAVRPAGTARPDRAARDHLESIRTMDVRVVFFGVGKPAAADGGQGLSARTGLAAPQLEQDLFFFGAGAPAGLPALRASVGARFCVLGVLGVRAEDFPNATAPGDPLASPGWFLAPAPRS